MLLQSFGSNGVRDGTVRPQCRIDVLQSPHTPDVFTAVGWNGDGGIAASAGSAATRCACVRACVRVYVYVCQSVNLSSGCGCVFRRSLSDRGEVPTPYAVETVLASARTPQRRRHPSSLAHLPSLSVFAAIRAVVTNVQYVLLLLVRSATPPPQATVPKLPNTAPVSVGPPVPFPPSPLLPTVG